MQIARSFKGKKQTQHPLKRSNWNKSNRYTSQKWNSRSKTMHRPQPISKPKRVFSPSLSRRYYWGDHQNVKILRRVTQKLGRTLLRAARPRVVRARRPRRNALSRRQARRRASRRRARALRKSRLLRRIAASVRRARRRRAKRIDHVRSYLGFSQQRVQAKRTARRAAHTLKTHTITYPLLRALIIKRRRKSRRRALLRLRRALRRRARRPTKFGPRFPVRKAKAVIKKWLLSRAKSRRLQHKVRKQVSWKRWLRAAKNKNFLPVTTKEYQRLQALTRFSPKVRPALDRNFYRKFKVARRHLRGERSQRRYAKGRRTYRRLSLSVASTSRAKSRLTKAATRQVKQLQAIHLFELKGRSRRARRQLQATRRLTFLLKYYPKQASVELKRGKAKDPIFFTPKKVNLQRSWTRGTTELQAQIREKAAAKSRPLSSLLRYSRPELNIDAVKSRALALRPVRSNILTPFKRVRFPRQPRRRPRRLRMRRSNALTTARVHCIVRKVARRLTARPWRRTRARHFARRLSGRWALKNSRGRKKRGSKTLVTKIAKGKLPKVAQLKTQPSTQTKKPAQARKLQLKKRSSRRKRAARALLLQATVQRERAPIGRLVIQRSCRNHKRALRAIVARRKAFRQFGVKRGSRMRFHQRNEEEKEQTLLRDQARKRRLRRLRKRVKNLIHRKKSLGYRAFLKRRARRARRKTKRQLRRLTGKKNRAWLTRKARPAEVTLERRALATAARKKVIEKARYRHRVLRLPTSRRRISLRKYHLRLITSKQRKMLRMPGPASQLHTRRRALLTVGEFGNKKFMRSPLTWTRRRPFLPKPLKRPTKWGWQQRKAFNQLRRRARRYARQLDGKLPALPKSNRHQRVEPTPKRIPLKQTPNKPLTAKRKREIRSRLEKINAYLQKFLRHIRLPRRKRDRKRGSKKARRTGAAVRRFRHRAKLLAKIQPGSAYVNTLVTQFGLQQRAVRELIRLNAEIRLGRETSKGEGLISSPRLSMYKAQQALLTRTIFQARFERALLLQSNEEEQIQTPAIPAVPALPAAVATVKNVQPAAVLQKPATTPIVPTSNFSKSTTLAGKSPSLQVRGTGRQYSTYVASTRKPTKPIELHRLSRTKNQNHPLDRASRRVMSDRLEDYDSIFDYPGVRYKGYTYEELRRNADWIDHLGATIIRITPGVCVCALLYYATKIGLLPAHDYEAAVHQLESVNRAIEAEELRAKAWAAVWDRVPCRVPRWYAHKQTWELYEMMLQNTQGVLAGLPYDDALNCYLQHQAEYVAALQEAVAKAVKTIAQEESPLARKQMRHAFIEEFRSGPFEKRYFAKYGSRVVSTALVERPEIVDSVLRANRLSSAYL